MLVNVSPSQKVTQFSGPRRFILYLQEIHSSHTHLPIIMEEAREEAGEDTEWADGKQVHIHRMASTV